MARCPLARDDHKCIQMRIPSSRLLIPTTDQKLQPPPLQIRLHSDPPQIPAYTLPLIIRLDQRSSPRLLPLGTITPRPSPIRPSPIHAIHDPSILQVLGTISATPKSNRLPSAPNSLPARAREGFGPAGPRVPVDVEFLEGVLELHGDEGQASADDGGAFASGGEDEEGDGVVGRVALDVRAGEYDDYTRDFEETGSVVVNRSLAHERTSI